MSLADLVIETATVKVGKTTITVRGLCFNDIAQILRPYSGKINEFIATLANGKEAGDDADIGIDPVKILSDMPEVAALVIALACDEPDQVEKVARMNGISQLEALIEITRLTIVEAGGLGKLVGLITTVVSGIGPAISQARNGIESLGE